MSEISRDELDRLLDPVRLMDDSARRRFLLLFTVRHRFGRSGVELLRSLQSSGEELTDEEMMSRIEAENSR